MNLHCSIVHLCNAVELWPFLIILYLRRLCRAEVHLQSHDFVVCRSAFSRPPRKSHLSGHLNLSGVGTMLLPQVHDREPSQKKKHKSLGAKLLFNTCDHSEDSAQYQ